MQSAHFQPASQRLPWAARRRPKAVGEFVAREELRLEKLSHHGSPAFATKQSRALKRWSSLPRSTECESSTSSGQENPDLKSVADSRLVIDALARRIQALPAEIRWAYAQQDMIVATAQGVPVRPGPRTARIGLFLKWAAKIGLDVVAAKLASLMLLAAVRYRQSRAPATGERRHYFVGISALRERELVPQFAAMVGEPAAVVDQRFSGALASIYPPSTMELLRSWRDAARPVFADIASAQGSGLLDRSARLSYIVRRLHHYAHFLAVFRGLNAVRPGTVVAFATADLPAYAAVRAGIKATYFPHGFLARSLVLPDFHRVIAFNAPEAGHLRQRLPHASLSPPAFDMRPLEVTRRVAVVGDYGDKLGRSRGFIEFCRSMRIDVVVRPHPADRSDYWAQWERVGGVRIDRVGSFDEFLDRHRPGVMATWYSTTIFDALKRGVLPVTLEADQPDIVFPFSDVALCWPEQKEEIQAALADDRARRDALNAALKLATALPHVDDVSRSIARC